MMPDDPSAIDVSSSEFIAEIKDDLASLEPDLLAMEEKGDKVDDELINHAFRSIHSIKGGAGFINFTALSSLSHAMENVLMQVREKQLVITSDIVDALLAGFDGMKLLIDTFGIKTPGSCKEQEKALQKILDNDSVQQSFEKSKKRTPDLVPGTSSLQMQDSKDKVKFVEKKIKPEKVTLDSEDAFIVVQPINDTQRFKDREFKVNRKRFENARESQKFVYAIHIRLEEDVQAQQKKIKAIIEDIKSIGEILYSDLESENLEPQDNGFFCVISTILDLPLLSQVLEINKTQVTLVGRKMDDGSLEPDPLAPSLSAFAGRSEPGPVIEKVLPAAQNESHDDSLLNLQSASFPTGQTIRISVDLVTRLMNRAGELVLSRNQLRPIMASLSSAQRQTLGVMQNLDIVITDIQETIMQMRMQPIGDLVSKYKRVIRDIARRMSKKVDFLLEGADVEVDRNILEKLANPLTHLIRNCIDHGIESPDKRKQLGKPETGIIHIKTSHQGGYVHIRISDDGAGIDPQLVLSKAFEKGLISEELVGTLTEDQKTGLIFLPGFSTSEEITDISGRGVGMDVVKTNIERLRGQIEIESVQGKGTCVHLIIPLTLAIVPSLIVGVGDARFAVPQVNIKEVIYLEPGQIHDSVEKIAGSEILRLRDQLLPVIRLRNVLSITTYLTAPDSDVQLEEKRKAIADRRDSKNRPQGEDKRSSVNDRRQYQWDATYVMVLKLGDNRFGMCVDELFDIEEVVVEPLDHYLKHLKYFAAATIMGDGGVIMMLDVAGIAAVCDLKFEGLPKRYFTDKLHMEEQAKERLELRNLIVFGNNNTEYFGLPLHSVSRLEPIMMSDIHHSGDQAFFDYHGQAIQLFSLDEFLPVSPFESNDEMFIIFPKQIQSNAGILVSMILDTIETREALSTDVTCPDLVAGKLFLNDQMIQVLDHDLFFKRLDTHASQTKDKQPFRP